MLRPCFYSDSFYCYRNGAPFFSAPSQKMGFECYFFPFFFFSLMSDDRSRALDCAFSPFFRHAPSLGMKEVGLHIIPESLFSCRIFLTNRWRTVLRRVLCGPSIFSPASSVVHLLTEPLSFSGFFFLGCGAGPFFSRPPSPSLFRSEHFVFFLASSSFFLLNSARGLSRHCRLFFVFTVGRSMD